MLCTPTLWDWNEFIFSTFSDLLKVKETWARSWLVKVNEKNTTFRIFCLSNQQQRVHMKLNVQMLHQEDAPTHLSVTLDRRLTCK